MVARLSAITAAIVSSPVEQRPLCRERLTTDGSVSCSEAPPETALSLPTARTTLRARYWCWCGGKSCHQMPMPTYKRWSMTAAATVPLIDLCFRCSNYASRLTDFGLSMAAPRSRCGGQCDSIIGQRDGGPTLPRTCDPHSYRHAPQWICTRSLQAPSCRRRSGDTPLPGRPSSADLR